jgi:outer membrane protein OmpA-like peptidoglycan-associated protein
MTPSGKIVVGLVATGVVAAAAHSLTRSSLLSDLGSRSAAVMAENGIADGRTDWVSDSGWTFRTARISGTADAATRARTLAAISALDGIHDAVWVDGPHNARAKRPPAVDCGRRVAAILATQPVTFAAGGNEFGSGTDAVIDALALALRSCPAARVEVVGHSAPAANMLFGLALSQARAEAVADALARRGIDPRSLEPIGLGTTPDDPTDSIRLRIRPTTTATSSAGAAS